MLQAPWGTQTTPYFPSSQEPYLQLADPLLQCPRAFRDGALLGQGGFKAMDDPVRLLDLLFQAQSSLGSVVRKQQSASSVPYPDALQIGSPEHSLLLEEVAQAMHIIVSVFDIVEDHRQLQGSRACRLSRQKCLTLLLGCLLLTCQALKALCCALTAVDSVLKVLQWRRLAQWAPGPAQHLPLYLSQIPIQLAHL